MIPTNRVKAATLVVATRLAKKTRLITCYYYEKLDHLKTNYSNIDKNQIEVKKKIVIARINKVKIDEIQLDIDLDLFFNLRNV